MLLLLAAAQAADPLPFDEALAQLRANSPDLAQAEARVRAARAQVGSVRALLLPTVTVSGAYTRNDQEFILDFADSFPDDLPIEIDFPDPVTLQPLDAWTGAATVTVPLVVPAAWGQLGAASAAVDAVDAGRDGAEAALTLALAQIAVARQVAAGTVAASERALETAQAHHDAIARAVEAGTQPPLARLSAEAEVLRRQQQFAQARADLRAAERAAGALLGGDTPVSVAPPAPDVPDTRRDTAEIQAADAQLTAATRRRTAATLGYAPALAASFTAQASTQPFVTGDDTAWRAQLGLTWTLLDGGARESRLAEAAANVALARASAESARIKVSKDEADAREALEVARTRADLAARQRDVAREAEAVSRRGLAAGTVSPLDARDAAERAFAADIGAEQAQAAVSLAAAALRRARGW
jgi:outer membrane protein TolC